MVNVYYYLLDYHTLYCICSCLNRMRMASITNISFQKQVCCIDVVYTEMSLREIFLTYFEELVHVLKAASSFA